jgi:hypothetical protein
METDDPSLHVLSLAQHHAFSFLKNLDRAPAGATVDVQTLRRRLHKACCLDRITGFSGFTRSSIERILSILKILKILSKENLPNSVKPAR